MNKYFKYFYLIIFFIFFGVFLFWWGIFAPKDFLNSKTINYVAQKGQGDEEIALELKKIGIINSSYFFRFYVVFSGQHAKLQAGTYSISSGMSTKQIVDKFAKGDIIKDQITLVEGWNLEDIKKYFISKNICTAESFSLATKKDYSSEFEFLLDKPKDVNLEGYIFPDTYQFLAGDSCETIIKKTLNNFQRKLGEKNYFEINKQKKTVFDVVVLASIIEKEVVTLTDKKMVAGILNNRLESGMPLQVDVAKDTYKFAGLPDNPISNPGLDSILAAIYPTESNYMYYLSTKDGKTIFSKTLAEHNAAIAKYLK